MNQRVVVPSSGIQPSSLAPARIIEITKPERGQSIAVKLSGAHGTQLDLSAVAHESLQLVHTGTKLVIQFDNQSTIVADPFFESSGRPFSHLDVSFGGGNVLSGEQFAALISSTVGQSQPDADKIPASGADFHNAAIDALPTSAAPLALLGQDSHKSPFGSSSLGGGDGASAHALVLDPTPVVTIPAPGGAATLVFEGGLLASRGPGESAGSHAGSTAFPVTTKAGLIGFTAPDGLQTVSLGGHVLTTSPQTFADATGSLTASYAFDAATHKGTISYIYTLLDNTLGSTNATFAVVVTDIDGHRNAPGNLVITVADDTPIARADADNITIGQVTAETGNVLTGIGTALGAAGADVAGADGGISVVGVAAGTGAGGTNPTSVGVAIAGAFGTLTLNADGTYSYVHGVGGGADVFTYTIRDADGSLAHTTLTIRIPDSAPGNIAIPPAGNPATGTEVFEAGLPARTIGGAAEPAGSHTGDPAFPPATSGTIAFTSAEGVSKIELGGLVLTAAGAPQTFTDATGTLTASFVYDAATGTGIISYTYTLLDNTQTDLSSKSFAVAVTDVDGDRAQGGNLTITVVDDAPVAHADTDSFAAGQVTAETGNVLTGAGTTSGVSGQDVPGADGAVVAGVAAGDTATDMVNAATVGVAIAGAFGRLTLNADGSYTYVHTGSPGGGNDVFTYTIRDADGDISHATLTIAVADSTPGNVVTPPPGNAGAGTEVFEAGLLASRGPGESAGSDAGNPDGNAPTAASGTITFTSADGVRTVELGGLVLTSPGTSQAFTDATGSLTASFTYDAATGQGTIHYTYTLLDNTLGVPGATFAVAVTDADGDRAQGGNLVISIADDAPVAHADTDSVTSGQVTGETGNVLTGAGTTSGVGGADAPGADGGVTVVGVEAGSTAGGVNAGTLGTAIAGALGTLTLNADGSYNYVHSAGAGGGADVFTYTIRDADGSLSHATLTITVADSTPGGIVIPPAGSAGAGTEVFEAGLLASRGAGESAGSDAGNPDGNAPTATSGVITFSSPDGVSRIELGGLVLTTAGTPQTIVDATGSLTASFTYDSATGQGTVTYTYSLLDNTLGAPNVSFSVAVTDADGDRTVGGDLVISIVDDAPAAHSDTDSVAAGQVTAETGNVLTGVGTSSGTPGADVLGADGSAGGAVVGVAAGDTGVSASGGVGTAITGAFGMLTLAADGSYSYVHIGTPGGGNDVFTYTIRDADGSLSHATLTITVADSSPGTITIPPAGNPAAGTEVFEAGLLASRGPGESAGSDAGNPDGAAPTATSGTISFSSPDGVQTVELGTLVLTSPGASQTFTDASGSLTAFYTFDAATGQGTVHYTYTLLDNTLGNASASFPVAVTDSDGDRTQGGNLVVTIADDAPVAHADTDAVAGDQVTAETGNVLTGLGTTGSSGVDAAGADGGVTVVSVTANGTTVAVDPATGAAIAGAFGTLTLNADGSYSYAREIGVAGGGHTDIFTYTIQDADGSLSSTTLAIAIANATPGDIVVPPPDTGETAVFEAGLPARVNGGVDEPAGSNPLLATTTTGTISFTSLDGVQSVELGSLVLHVGDAPQTFVDATGQLTAFVTYDAASGTGQVSYTYTLLDNTDVRNTPAVTFAVAVTDLDGDRAAGNNLVITIADDSPEAAPDSDAVAAGQTTPETGNVITGEGTDGGLNGSSADVSGADGMALVSIAFGGSVLTIDPASGATIAGTFGTLTIFSDGSYSYTRSGSSGSDIFTYTIQDGDGTQSSATLTIDIGDSTPRNILVPAPGGADTTVFEAGLPASRGAGVSAGSHSGEPAFPTTTQTGTITFTSPDGVSKIELGGLILTAVGTTGTFTDATGSLTASYTYDSLTGQGAISYTYTLLDNVTGAANPSFTVAVTDVDGDRTVGANLVIAVVDDTPTAIADTDAIAAGQSTAEIGNVITGAGTTSGRADVQGADGGVVVIGVARGDTGGGVVVGGVGAAIAGAFGTLTLNADGSYSYAHAGSAGGGTDVFTYTIQDADGSRSVATLAINVADSTPGGITIPAAGGADTTVFEAGLLASRGPGESAGSNPLAPTTASGTIAFASLDGVQSVELGSHVVTATSAASAQTFLDGATGSLSVWFSFDATTGQGVIHYSYILLDNTLGTGNPSFAVAVTDLDGDRTPGGNLVINIVDDAPVAHADTDALGAGQSAPETGNVITGVGTTSGAAGADVRGADDAAIAGVAAGNTGIDLVNAGSVGSAIHGAFGTLTLNADGSYSYVRDAGAPGGVGDVFTYTLRDGDGDLSHATLTITLPAGSAPGNVVIPPAGPATTVFEAGLPGRGLEPAGSHSGDPQFPTSVGGSISFTSPDGVQAISLGGHVLSNTLQTFTDPTGSLRAFFTFDPGTHQGQIIYLYTLLDNTLGAPNLSLAVVITDPQGESNPPTNLVVDIVDDAPVAKLDTDSVASGQLTAETGNVITGVGTTSGPGGADVQGADGALVAGVAASNTGVDLVNAATVGVAIAGAFGTLTLNADGSYSYLHNGSPGGGTDVFTYTIRDADGGLSHATLTINVGNSTPGGISIPVTGGTDTTVFEAGLLSSRGSGESPGSDAGNPDGRAPTSTTGTVAFTSADGVSRIELGSLVLTVADTPQTITDAIGSLTAFYTYDVATGRGAVHYTYSLLDNSLGTPSASFAVAVTDRDGDRTPGGNLVINITDDAPTAKADTDSIASGQITAESGNVLTGAGTTSGPSGADVRGADGAVVAGVAAGNTGTNLVNAGSVGVAIGGAFGALTLNADGSYSYLHNGSAGGGTDIFTYTIRDADGSLSHATLTIAVADSTPGGINIPAAGGTTTTVFEAGLPASRGSGESAGTDPGNPDGQAPTITSGTITFTSADGVSKVELGGITLVAAGTPGTFTDATGSLTAYYTYDAATAQGTIHYSYTLLDNTDARVKSSVSFAVAVTDLDGDRASGGNLLINIVDDASIARADSVGLFSLENQTTGNVITGTTVGGPGGADIVSADGGPLHVVGIATGSGTTVGSTLAVGPSGVTIVEGLHGTLTIDASGSYSYLRTSGGIGDSDVFTYSIADADGSLSTTTLTVTIDNIAPGNFHLTGERSVFESGLPARTINGVSEPAGTDAGNPDGNAPTTVSGIITFTSLDGVSSITANAGGDRHTLSGSPTTFADVFGFGLVTLSYAFSNGVGTISYSYTLTDNDNALIAFPFVEFDLRVFDTHAASTFTPLVISIVDDAPIARDDSDVSNNAVPKSGNVISGIGTISGTGGADSPGADGSLAVVGLAVGDTGANLNNTTTVNAQIHGLFGTLTLQANGNYSYVTDNGAVGRDVFTYTVRDVDGSMSHARLVLESGPGNFVFNGPATVFEAGLQARPGEAPGTQSLNPAFPTDTTGTITFSSLQGVSSVTIEGFALSTTPGSVVFATSGNRLVAWYAFDAATHNGTINYTYSLLDNNVGTSFHVNVLDTNNHFGSTVLNINLVDDKPIARNDVDGMVNPRIGSQESGNVMTGSGTSNGTIGGDSIGADGPAIGGVVGIVQGTFNGLPVPITTGVGTLQHGLFGDIVMQADGSYTYTYQFNGDPGGNLLLEDWSYTIQDSEGDKSSAVLELRLVFTAGATSPTIVASVLPGDGNNESHLLTVSSPNQLDAGHSIFGSADAISTDTLVLDGGGAYDLAAGSVKYIDAIRLGATATNVSITVGDALVSTADFNKDGIGGDLQISATAPLSGGVSIDASSLTGSNYVIVDGTNMNGDNTFKGAAGADILIGGNGNDILTGGGDIDTLKGAGGSNHFVFNSPGEGGDHIIDFKHGSDSIDVLLANFAGLSGKGAVAGSDFVTSTNAATVDLGSAHFAYNASTGQLFYDSNGGDASAASRVLLAVLDNHAALAATDIHKV